jgi:exopolyphosphatase/guanosine-5'-triphosphate,3'-diphosphate pyrophosphatase
MGQHVHRPARDLAHLQQGRYRRIAYLKETVRLGGGLDANGYLTEAAAQRGLDCLRQFAARLQGYEPSQVRAVATQTLREARNRDEFLRAAQRALGAIGVQAAALQFGKGNVV